MNNKKGFEIQFNWIFVLIVGAIIIIFFTTIIVKQKNVSETSVKVNILQGMQSIISGASASLYTTSTIDIPDSEIKIDCNKIAVGAASKQYQNLILFAPSLIKGAKLVSQTLPFNAPFRTTNILYMTSPKIRYIIIGNNNIANQINSSLPFGISKENYSAYEPSKIKNMNNYKVKFVFVNTNFNFMDFPGSLAKMPDDDVTAVKITGGDKGIVDFYRKNGNSWAHKDTSSYIGINTLLGAVYSDTAETYICNMQHIFSKTSLVANIYHDRTNELKQLSDSNGKTQCSGSYANALTFLNSISSASPESVDDNVNAIDLNYNLLKDENKKLEAFSCPLIY